MEICADCNAHTRGDKIKEKEERVKHGERRMTNKMDVDGAISLTKIPKRIPIGNRSTATKAGRKDNMEKLVERFNRIDRQIERNNARWEKKDEIDKDHWKRIEELEDEGAGIKDELEQPRKETRKTAESPPETLKKEIAGVRQETKALTTTISRK